MLTNQLDYYSIGFSDEVLGKHFAHIEEDLVNEESEKPFDLFIPDPSLKKARGFVVHRRKKLPDHLFCTCATWFLISHKALRVFQNVRCCESIRWIPTAICAKNGYILDGYQLAYGSLAHDIWDYKRSDCHWVLGKPPGSKEAVGYMRRGLICASALPVAYDFFRATEGKWVASRRLRDLIKEEKLTGFAFNKLDI
jgi:hypothetical protein